MIKNKFLVIIFILVYSSLGLGFALLINKTLPWWVFLILWICFIFVNEKIGIFYANKNIKLFDKIKLSQLGAFIAIIIFLIVVFRLG